MAGGFFYFHLLRIPACLTQYITIQADTLFIGTRSSAMHNYVAPAKFIWYKPGSTAFYVGIGPKQGFLYISDRDYENNYQPKTLK